MYLQSFDVYAEQRFVLIICSERGKGKSVRAERLGKLLPEGFAATQAASSARAGMNGKKMHLNYLHIAVKIHILIISNPMICR